MNRRGLNKSINERLDRFLASKAWCNMFPSTRVTHAIATHSDHIPIILYESTEALRMKKKLFRFEAMWMEAKDCESVITKSWQEGNTELFIYNVAGRIDLCSQRLEIWNKQKFGFVHKHIQKAREQLKLIQESDPHYLRMDDHQAARNTLQCWLEHEELLWK